MKQIFLITLGIFACLKSYCWGFYAHQRINYFAVFLLPPEMLVFYKPHLEFLSEHAVDPDKRRYIVPEEGSRHYIDIDHYGIYPFDSLPRRWKDAVARFGEDSLNRYGIVPWHIQTVLHRLTEAFKKKDFDAILRNSADLGHYISDAHVPLHACSNHNGQFTDQHGIHGFWESRIPELLAEKEFDFFIGNAGYIDNPGNFIWDRVLESALAADTVLRAEKTLSEQFPPNRKYAFEERNGKLIKQYSSEYTLAYHKKLGDMVERRMRQSMFAIACFWYTAWVNAGQPDLKPLLNKKLSAGALQEMQQLNNSWKEKSRMIGREE